MKDYYIITFESTQNAIYSESIFKELLIKSKIISIPPQISAGCGFCIKISIEDLEKSLQIIKERDLKFSYIYKIKMINFKKEIEKIY